MQIAEVLQPTQKLACMTLDFETDYGNRVGGAFNILEEKEQLAQLAALYSDLNVPLSAFIRTDLLTTYPKSIDLVQRLATDLHCHSHTHTTQNFISEFEIAQTQQTFTTIFGRPALGYRAPLGILYDNDVALLAQHGFKFSSSVFPTWFPGRFNNRQLPATPFLYANGLVELPFAVIQTIRSTVSLSFLKLFGLPLYRSLFARFGLPEIIVFDSHLHDYIVSHESYSQLPRTLRWAWGINKYAGMRYCVAFVELLRKAGYEFISMTQLYAYVLSLAADRSEQ